MKIPFQLLPGSRNKAKLPKRSEVSGGRNKATCGCTFGGGGKFGKSKGTLGKTQLADSL